MNRAPAVLLFPVFEDVLCDETKENKTTTTTTKGEGGRAKWKKKKRLLRRLAYVVLVLPGSLLRTYCDTNKETIVSG